MRTRPRAALSSSTTSSHPPPCTRIPGAVPRCCVLPCPRMPGAVHGHFTALPRIPGSVCVCAAVVPGTRMPGAVPGVCTEGCKGQHVGAWGTLGHVGTCTMARGCHKRVPHTWRWGSVGKHVKDSPPPLTGGRGSLEMVRQVALHARGGFTRYDCYRS